MHEMGLCDAIVAAAVREAGGRPVKKLRVRVSGHPVDPDVIDQGFRMAATGTVAAGADVELIVDPLTVRCRDCRAQTPASDALVLVACPRCGGIDVDVPEAGDVTVESISLGTSTAGSP